MDNIEFKYIQSHDYADRVLFWPTNPEEDDNEIFSGDGPNNFWRLSEQYYSISWTLWSAGFRERIEWPYSGNIASKSDEEHKKKLSNKIADQGWTPATFQSFGHLSCELAFKAIIFHKSNKLNEMSFPKVHDLEKLLGEFNPHTRQSFVDQYEKWGHKMDLNKIIHNSGQRFIDQRYGTDDSGDYWGTVNLCRFIHEEFKLENTPAELTISSNV